MVVNFVRPFFAICDLTLDGYKLILESFGINWIVQFVVGYPRLALFVDIAILTWMEHAPL